MAQQVVLLGGVERCLRIDLAAGTGTSSMSFTHHGAEVVAGDISEGMLAEGRRRHPKIDFVYADALDLPFEDETFDVVTISFGIRNVHDVDRALAEMLRVIYECPKPTIACVQGDVYAGGMGLVACCDMAVAADTAVAAAATSSIHPPRVISCTAR